MRDTNLRLEAVSLVVTADVAVAAYALTRTASSSDSFVVVTGATAAGAATANLVLVGVYVASTWWRPVRRVLDPDVLEQWVKLVLALVAVLTAGSVAAMVVPAATASGDMAAPGVLGVFIAVLVATPVWLAYRKTRRRRASRQRRSARWPAE